MWPNDKLIDSLEIEHPIVKAPCPSFGEPRLEEVLKLRPRVVSFHFGLPRVEMARALQGAGWAGRGSLTDCTHRDMSARDRPPDNRHSMISCIPRRESIYLSLP